MWEKLSKAASWLFAHWKLPLAAAASVLAYGVLRRGGPDAQERLDVKLDAISTKLRVAQLAADQGVDAARKHVEETYAKEMASLTSDQKEQADKLILDPPALAAFLVSAGRGPA